MATNYTLQCTCFLRVMQNAGERGITFAEVPNKMQEIVENVFGKDFSAYLLNSPVSLPRLLKQCKEGGQIERITPARYRLTADGLKSIKYQEKARGISV